VRDWELMGRRNGVLPIEALRKKASMSAAYAADPFYFVCSFESENLRDRAVE